MVIKTAAWPPEQVDLGPDPDSVTSYHVTFCVWRPVFVPP